MLILLTDIKELTNNLENIINEKTQMLAQGLAFEGVEVVNKARRCTPACGSFRDRTGNLRSSIGFRIVNKYYETLNFEAIKGGSKGVNKGKEIAKNINTEGISLIIVAGMEYANDVEARGYKVLSAFLPDKQQIEKTIKEFLE